jgi:hypothetical protein
MKNIDSSRLDGKLNFTDIALSSPGEIEISAALCVKNVFDESGFSLAVVETVKGSVWRMIADKSWSCIQGNRELPAMLIVPITDNEANIDEKWSGDFQKEVSKGIVIRFADWFVIDSLPDGRNVIEGKISGVTLEHKSFAESLNDLMKLRYEAESGV